MWRFNSQRGDSLNKKMLSVLLVFALLLLSTIALFITNSKVALADEAQSSIDIEVNHQLTVHDGGLVTLNDTVILSKKPGEQAPLLQSFRIGFPYQYKSNIYYVFACETKNPEKSLAFDLDAGFGTPGFYAVRVHFGREINLTQVESYSFTVMFELSDLITAKLATGELLELSFPMYPSLEQNATKGSTTTVFLPSSVSYNSSDPVFNQTASNTLNAVKKPLEAFTSVVGSITFNPTTSFTLLDVNEVRRTIVLDEWNNLLVSDFYSTTNKAENVTSTIWTMLPEDALDPIYAKDDLGNVLNITQQNEGDAIKAIVTLKSALQPTQTAHVLIAYKLPWKNHVKENGWSDFSLNFKLFEPTNLTVRKLTVTIDLPEGAEFQSSNATIQPDIVQMGIYKETPTFTLSNISPYQNLDFTIWYRHVVFWASFRPTLWTGALVVVIAAIASLWQIRRAPALVPTVLPIRPEEFINYVKTYDERKKILQERQSLEVQAQKGKVPRRLYRVRSRTLDSRLSVLSRDLAVLRERIRTAGPRYAGMMRQIEVAETELQGVEADIRRTEARYRRGEISAAAYHKLLEDSYRRRDRAKTNIDGVLLRLREEIS